ncbi:MAG: hypothetical protein HPY53_01795 [Brevinematales bacterium]|nr:hypothetical protein [Brevinematales bacterium]
MKRVLFLIAGFVLFANSFYAVEFLSSDKIIPGMKGYGITVFHGWTPERFEVEIIDVMKNSVPGPNGDVILARCTGNILDKSGVIAGMSGSPVYIDGKLIGAVSSTWAYSKDSIAGITPIARMLEQKDLHNPAYFSGKSSLKKIATPIVLHGVYGDAKKMANDFFMEKGFMTCDGIGGGISTPDDKTLQPGDSIAINLVDGDLNIAAIGTVTYVSNNDIYIFGHPFDQFGNLRLPISKSYVYTVIPSIGLSFKLGAGSEPSGSTIFDGEAAVYCQSGAAPTMIPLKVIIDSPSGKNEFNYRIADDNTYFPMLASVALSSSMSRVMGIMDNKTISYDFRMKLLIDGKETIFTNSYIYSIDPSFYSYMFMLMDLRYYFTTFMNTDLAKVKVLVAQVRITIRQGVNYFVINDAFSDKPGYFPGETVNVHVMMREYLSEVKSYSIPLTIPKEIQPGKYKIFIASQPSVYYQITKLFPDIAWVQSMKDLLHNSSMFLDNTMLEAVFISIEDGVQLSDKKMPKFPNSYISLLNIKNIADRFYLFPNLTKGDLQFMHPIFGFQQLQINVYEEKKPKKQE